LWLGEVDSSFLFYSASPSAYRHSLAMGFQSSFADIIIRKTHERARTMSHLGFLLSLRPTTRLQLFHNAFGWLAFGLAIFFGFLFQ
jgi:hypothetical protein